jgi:hypothetical protein
MKQITVTETVYTLDELSDTARQKALEKMCQSDVRMDRAKPDHRTFSTANCWAYSPANTLARSVVKNLTSV